MSVRIMAEVFDRYPGGGTELLLALAIADHAHDDGTNVYPSVKRLAEKTRQSERSVQYHLRKMETDGWLLLVREAIGGRGAAGIPREYRINPAWINGANFSPAEKGANPDGKGCNPAQERVQPSAEKGATAIAPEPPYNHQETVREPPAAKPKRESRKRVPNIELPDWIPRKAWDDFVAMRNEIRKPLSDAGADLAVKRLDKLRGHGHAPGAVLEQSTLNSWQGLFAVKPEYPNGSTHAAGRRESAAERSERINRELDHREGLF